MLVDPLWICALESAAALDILRVSWLLSLLPGCFKFQACLLTDKGIGLSVLEYFLVSHRSASGTYAE